MTASALALAFYRTEARLLFTLRQMTVITNPGLRRWLPSPGIGIYARR